MSDPPPPNPGAGGRPRRQGLWLTVGEGVAVLALVIAGLNYWDSHQQRIEETRRARAQAQAQTRAATTFVNVGEADKDGRYVILHPLRSSQAVQSQRYRFPAEILDHPVEITAERPRIEADWLAGGVKRALDQAGVRGAGEARIPMVIETTYVEDGDTLTDVSLYQLGVSWKHTLLGGRQVRLTGLALSRRHVEGDSASLLQARWTAARAALASIQ